MTALDKLMASLLVAADLVPVAAGAIVGASLRHVSTLKPLLPARPELNIALVNVVGSTILGSVYGLSTPSASVLPKAVDAATAPLSRRATLLLGVGFCGSLTTFSTFSVDMVKLLEAGALSRCASLAFFSNVGGLAGATLGVQGARALRGVLLK